MSIPITYIYVKHAPKGLTIEAPDGLMYLGITKTDIKNKPNSYNGSGIRWNKHINAHNILPHQINTYILHVTNDKEDLKKCCIYYSKLFNVTKSRYWANEKDEIGDGGFCAIAYSNGGKKAGEITKNKKIGIHDPEKRRDWAILGGLSLKGVPKSEEWKQKNRKPKAKAICPHCNKITSKNNRYHFDNCKLKK